MLTNEGELDEAVLEVLRRPFFDWLSYGGRDLPRARAARARYEFAAVAYAPSENRYAARHPILKILIDPIGEGRRIERKDDVIVLSRPRPKGTLRAYYLDAVETDSTLAYRGMSWEEWTFIQDREVVQSRGEYNIGQQNLTLWGDTFSTAAYYANGFTPWPFKPSFDLPGVVIAIPRALTIGPKQHKEVPEGELATVGPLDAQHIQHVWLLQPKEVEGGYYEFKVVEQRGRDVTFDVQRGSSPSAEVYVEPIRF